MAAGDSAKADQIAFHIYTKLFHVLYAARASDQGPPSGKADKWVSIFELSGLIPSFPCLSSHCGTNELFYSVV